MAGNRVALALGSGGARGYAHIGGIDELRHRGYDIVGIAGSSMGALVGGLQAAGRLDEFADWAKSLTQRAVLRLLDPSITAAGERRKADSDTEEIGDRGSHPPALLATGQCGRFPARGVERVAPERGE
jgi:NTE family protein